MRRFLRVFWVVLLAVCFLCASHAQAATLCVDLDGIDPNGNACYTRIRQAILAAGSGDIIIIYPGIYNENIDFIGKAITVRSVDPNDPDIVDMTIIDGGEEGPVVSFIEEVDSNTVVSGLTLTNGEGGIYCRTASPQITHCTITGNSVDMYGAGIYCEDASPRIYQCVIVNNSAGLYGGGIYCDASSPDIIRCTIGENSGGGIFCEDGSAPDIIQCIIRENTTNSSGTYGAGIHSVNASPNISDCTIQDNAVYGIYYEDASSARTITGCSIIANNSIGIRITGPSPPNITQCTINDNKGIGIYSDSNAPSTIDNCTIGRNESHGISSFESPLNIIGCTIYENRENGIYGEGSGLSVDQCTIADNEGDGIRCNKDSSPSISNCTIEKNEGSGIYAEYSIPDIEGCTISENGRGGIYSGYSSPEISNCAIVGNTSGAGGGIYCSYSYAQSVSPSHITNCTINDNQATSNGGGIYCNRIELSIDNCVINNNRASNGGGIWSYGNPVDITRCIIYENVALSSGGGILNNVALSNVVNCVVSYNKAQFGGGIYCYKTNIMSCTIVENQGVPYGGIFSTSGTIVSNSIIWNNLPSEISGSYYKVAYSDIRGGYTGEGNINANPLFIQGGIGNYYLNLNSPCIDSGDPNAPYVDKEGIPRPQAEGMDMGAYEYVASDSCIPRASFVTDTIAGNTPLTVEFDASSSGGSEYPGAEFEWDFGDGNSGSGLSIAHTYNNYGFHGVRLTITTECGSHTLALSNCIKVGSTPPTREVGEGYEYDSIQGAIDDAEDGEYVLVHDGTYFENINFKGKGIILRSENGAAKTIIDGGAQGSVVTFDTYEGVFSVLEGFTLQNGSATNGGGIYCSFSSPAITRCTIRRNATTNYGSGIYCYCSSALITNCIINGNRTGGDGGIYCISSLPYIVNTTITENVGGSYGGIRCDNYSSPTIRNCILWNNLPREIYPNNLPVAYSIILGGYNGEGNIDGDPLFVGSDDENYYLNPNSPCIDRGDPTDAPLIDKEGIPRPQGAEVDIGAYEYVETDSCMPRATFTADETAGAYPLTVRFVASASGGGDYDGAAFDWDFGDGTTAQGEIVEHIYNDPNDFNDPDDPYGSYDVSLTITTDCGSHTLTLDDFIKITSVLPTREVGHEGDYPYSSIQEAIDDARNGEHILVHDGIYYENIDFKGKRLFLRSENGTFTTFIDGGENGSVVTFDSGEDQYAVLEGFTIRNGSSNNGGGINCWGASPGIRNCYISENQANSSGGGIYCFASSSLRMDTCTIWGNTGSSGGGIYSNYSSLYIYNCIISGSEDGGGIYLNNSSGEIYDSTVTGNIRGGILCYTSSPYIINSIIAKNKDDNAGGIYCSSSSPVVINCTIADNEVGYGAGGVNCYSSSPLIINCILWNPRSPREIDTGSGCNAMIICSDVQGSGYEGDCNIDADPLFVADWAGNYYIRPESPCIDGGEPGEAPPFDNIGIARPQGNGVDMGAYEHVDRNDCTPRPCFIADKVPGSDPLTYAFDALCSGGALCDEAVFVWDFGDGTTAEGVMVEHTYSDFGFYEVSLTIDIDGESSTLALPDFVKIIQPPTDATQVCPGGTCNYEKIQDAIDNAEDGDLILVHDGTYDENIDFKGKGITLYSANGPDRTIIDGGAKGSVVTFKSREDMYSVLDGFTIQNGSAPNGGGIYCYFASPSISNCVIRENKTDSSTSGNGAGIYCYCSSPGITNCTITKNLGGSGGGIFFDRTYFPNITNCIITQNMAYERGGGVNFQSSSSPKITHCTIADNKSGNNGGGIYSNTPLDIINSILWNDSPQEISGQATANYSIIKGGYTGEGNIDADPHFVAPEIGNYYLRTDSPCIDKGLFIISFDAEEIPRPQGSEVDIGAYEYVNRMSAIPRASFEASPSEGHSSLKVSFDALSSGGWLYENALLQWDFGDETTLEGTYDECIMVEHTYTDYKYYEVSLTVRVNGNAHTLTLRDCIKVKATNPTREVGEGYGYSSIQEAIDDAQDGEYILVHDGTYLENISFKGKGITIRSENGADATVIEGSASQRVVLFDSGEDECAVLDGFTIQNSPNRNYDKVYCLFSSPVISGCVIKGQSTCCAENGYDDGSGIVCVCSSPHITNSIIIGNRQYNGGGISCSRNSSPLIYNCTISNNYAYTSGGAIYGNNSEPIIRNSILWGNLCGVNAVYNEINVQSRSLTITYSNIQGGFGDPNVTHNIDVDPLFVNPCGCNYSLQFNSPCIDAGTSEDAPAFDLDRKVRPILAGYDMGAYEYGEPLLPSICLVYQELSSCVDFDIGAEEVKEECTTEPSPGTPYLSIVDPNDPTIPYCTYKKVFLSDQTLYHWILRLDYDDYADHYLTWTPERLAVLDRCTWQLVRGDSAVGEVIVPDMTLSDTYQIQAGDGEYFSILLKKIPCYTFDIGAGWNLVSLPVVAEDMSRKAIFPEAVAVYYYDANERIYLYVEEDEALRTGIGYWVLVRNAISSEICGLAVTSYASIDSPEGLPLEQGWNMIGSLYGDTTIHLSNGSIRALYEYTNSGDETGYREPAGFDPNTGAYLAEGEGYWILPSEECLLDGDTSSESAIMNRLRTLPLIRFRDAASDAWTAQIAAYGVKSEDCASLARVIIGIADAPDRIPSPPYPPCTTIKLDVIDPPTDYTKYSRDLRAAGGDTYAWVLWVRYTESSDPNYPFLHWDFPSDVAGILELRKGGSETGDILVEDMRLTTSYRITAEDGELFTVVWRAEGCTTYYRDADGDGYGVNEDTQCLMSPAPPYTATQGGDCNDSNENINPNAIEVCDGVDNNCSGEIDEGVKITFYRDADGDAYGNPVDTIQDCTCPPGYVENDDDCNDSDENINPAATEICDTFDNDCDGLVDEEGAAEICDGLDNDCDGLIDEEGAVGCTDYHRDVDGDGYGLEADKRCLCNPAPPHTATVAGDCDDTDPSIYPRSLSIVSAQGYTGQQGVIVSIEIDDALGVAGGDIFLTYDPNVLIAQEVRISPLLQDFLTDSYIIEHEGMVILVMANTEGLDAGQGRVAEVIFNVSEDATVDTAVPLTFDTLTIYNENGESLCTIPINGEFRIVEQGYKGDLNQDKQITAADAILVLKIAVGKITPSEYQEWAGDVNGDGWINSADAILILRAAVKKETIFSLNPDHGLPGTIVRVVGWNFGDEQGGSGIYFDNIAADPITWTNHEIETAVPADVETDPQVQVVNAYGIPSNSRVFIVDQENRSRMRLSCAAPRPRQGEEPRSISIPIETPAAPCEQVTIPIEVDDASGIAGMDCVLGFDPAVLMPVKAECTSLTNGFLIIYGNQGNGEFMVSLANHTGIESGHSGALITVTFEVVSGARKDDTSGVEVKEIRLYDDNADPIEGISSESGRIIILGNGACDGNTGSGNSPVFQPSIPSIMPPCNPLNILYMYNSYPMGNWGFTGPQNFGASLSYQYQGGINEISMQNLNSGYHWLRALYTYSPYLWTMSQMNFGIAWSPMW